VAAKQEYPRYTVSSLTAGIKRALEGGFHRIVLDGEISGWRMYPSGHCYFTLKDEGAQISAVMFASAFQRCKAKDALVDGAKVSVFGDVSVYAPRGNYQINVLSAKIAGVGDLMQRYLELKAKLENEGLFDPSRKRPLPFMPRRIGIVTSEAGAVIHDMCNVLTRRFPNVNVRLFPCLVQGEAAPPSIIAGIKYFNSGIWTPDLLIVARGGGSFEDLFCFNDELLVRTLAASSVPTISAVGHETDFTLCDFVADKRAGTPSIAAELAVPVLLEIQKRIDVSASSLASALKSRGDFFAQRMDHISDALRSSLTIAAANAGRRLERMIPRLSSAVELRLQKAAAELEKLEAKRVAYSPYGVLQRGYSMTTKADGTIIRDAAQLHEGEKIVTRFAAGSAERVVL
jgi:exodeoxyribonuclease VII large subunit